MVPLVPPTEPSKMPISRKNYRCGDRQARPFWAPLRRWMSSPTSTSESQRGRRGRAQIRRPRLRVPCHLGRSERLRCPMEPLRCPSKLEKQPISRGNSGWSSLGAPLFGHRRHRFWLTRAIGLLRAPARPAVSPPRCAASIEPAVVSARSKRSTRAEPDSNRMCTAVAQARRRQHFPATERSR
jgi:hypothetical protein